MGAKKSGWFPKSMVLIFIRSFTYNLFFLNPVFSFCLLWQKYEKKTYLCNSFKACCEFVSTNEVIMENEFLAFEEKIVAVLKTVYDPEIPINI